MEDANQNDINRKTAVPSSSLSQQDFEALRQRYADELLAIRRSVDAMLGRTAQAAPQSSQPLPSQEDDSPVVPAEAVYQDTSLPPDPPAPPDPPQTEEPPEPAPEDIQPEPSPAQEIQPSAPPEREDDEVQNLDQDVPPEEEETLTPEGAKPAPLTDEATLQILVTAAQQAIPIPNVLVLLSRQDPGQPLETLIRVMTTDESGQTPVITLPAPDRALTQEPGEYRPYAVYRVVVVAEGYQPQFHGNVALFGGMSTLLPVEMIPLLEAPVPPPSRVGENYTSL